jgi:hypothetical protein
MDRFKPNYWCVLRGYKRRHLRFNVSSVSSSSTTTIYISRRCSQTSFSHFDTTYHVSNSTHPHLRCHHPPRQLQRAQRLADTRWYPRDNPTHGHHPHRPPWFIPQFRQLLRSPTPFPRPRTSLRTRELGARRSVLKSSSFGGWLNPLYLHHC